MNKTLHLERLLDLIRSEQVILFAGAGLSKYAGYPMGGQLQNIFYQSLSDVAKSEIEPTRSLADLTDDLFHLYKSNNQIIRILKDIYTKAPENSFVHDIISKIPHFKTIITTNYDELFENSFKENCEVLYNSSHVSLSDPKKTWIYKIHGDLRDSSSIIIKKTDYTNFFNPASQNSIFWNSVKDKMASNNILFIGYSLEDSNIDFIFTDILKQLGENKKEVFFIAPSLTQSKKNKLSSFGINFIEGTGEELFPLILEHINENILLDLKTNKVSSDTTYKFVEELGYNLTVKSNTASNFFVEKLEKVNGELQQKIHFTTKKNQFFAESLKKFIDGKTTEKKFKVPKAELLDLIVKVDNFKVQDLSGIEFLYIMKLPSYEGKIDIIVENGNSLIDFNIKVYKDIINDDFVLSFETNVSKGSITCSLESEGAYFNYTSELNDIIESPRELLDYLKCFASIMQGAKFTILKENLSVFSHKLITDKMSEDLVFMIDYLEKLLKIESLYMMRFRNLKRTDINETNYYHLKCLIAKSENVFLEEEIPSMRAILDDDFDKSFLSINEEQHIAFIAENIETKINIHDKEFVLGYKKSYIIDPIIINIDDVKSKKTNEALISNKSGKVKVGFYDTYEVPRNIK
ncbi:SIR2 family protein [Chryseobacterium gambrini]|uniref:SIR2 family protein n=1 Tax=Chryseobacterium gambrini TaxID=373672 RepID=UPI0025B51BB4|nr:SIR2 family protein [Chryseobacterium gambrini]MDN4028389.1 SIR2 family protein [Chryseobacterium gambrini]